MAALGFGASTVLVVAAEHVVLSPGYFASRQPWRRVVGTLAALSAACLPLGFVAGSCLAPRGCLAATLAAWRHACLRCVSSSLPMQRFGDLDVYAFAASRMVISLQCALVASAHGGLCDKHASFASFFLTSWHAAFLTDTAISFSSTMLGACLLEPLNYEVVAVRSSSANKSSVDLLLTALEIGDVGSVDDNSLRQAGIKRSAPSAQRGWFASPRRDPFDADAVDTAAPLWRREIDAQRLALWNLVQSINPSPSSPLAMPPLLSLRSGGIVLGSASQHSFELRLAKFLAIASLAQAAAAEPTSSSAAESIVAAAVAKNGAADQTTFAVSRALRACLLIIDAFTLRLEIASANSPSPQLEATSKLTVSRFDSIATRLRASKYTTRYYLDGTSRITAATAAAEAPSALEVFAVASAASALFALARDHRVPVAICSILGARRALWEWRPTQPRLDIRNLQLLFDAVLDRFCLAYAEAIPGFAFPTIYAPDLQRRIDSLANTALRTSSGAR